MGEPSWALGLALGLLAAGLAGRGEGRRDGPGAAPGGVPDLARGTARELRGVPGLGERRALALVDARWRRGPGDPPLLLGDVPGVGPAGEAAVAAWLAAHVPDGAR